MEGATAFSTLVAPPESLKLRRYRSWIPGAGYVRICAEGSDVTVRGRGCRKSRGFRASRKEPRMTFAEELPEFRVVVRPDGSDVWVDAEGEIDIYTSPRLRDAITEALALQPRNLYVDMSLVSFIDSSTISVLAASHKLAPSQETRLIIHAPARVVRRTLTLAGLIDHLNVED